MERLQLTDRTVDFVAQSVLFHGDRIALTDTESRLLRYLAARPDQDVSREALLTEVWGMAATSLSRCVDTAVRRIRRKIEARPDAPRHLLTVHGVGYRLTLAALSPARSARAVDDNGFIGRAEALERLGALLSDAARWVAVCGPGGVGKTRLVEAWLARHGGQLDGAICWIAARALDRRELNDQLSRRVDTRPDTAIVIVDGMENGPDGIAEALRAQLRDRPRLRALTTGRLVPREADSVLPLGGLPHAEALALLRAQARDHGAEIDDEDAAATLVVALDRLPLAIGLAARWVPLLGCRGLATRLDQRLQLLRDEDRSLRETIRWSIERLPPDAALALHQLACFRGGFSVDAAEEIIDVPGAPGLVALRQLQEASMLRVDHGQRLDLYDTVRAFLQESQGSPPQAARRRHAERMCRVADALREVVAPDLAGALEGLERERENLLAAWRWALSVPQTGALRVGLAFALVILLRHRGPPALRHEVLDQTLAEIHALPPERACLLLQLRSNARREAFALEAAAADLRRAVAIAKELDAQMEIAHCELSLGAIEHIAQRRGAALQLYQQALQRAMGRDDSMAVCCLINLSILHWERNQRAHAQTRAREAIAAASRSPYPRDLNDARHHLGWVLAQLGQHAESDSLLEACVAFAVETGDQRRRVKALWSLGQLRLDQARVIDARRAFVGSAEAARKVGAGLEMHLARAYEAITILLRGDHQLAAEQLADALRGVQPLSPARCVIPLAWSALAQQAARRPHLAQQHLALAQAQLDEQSSHDERLLLQIIHGHLYHTPPSTAIVDATAHHLLPRVVLRFLGGKGPKPEADSGGT